MLFECTRFESKDEEGDSFAEEIFGVPLFKLHGNMSQIERTKMFTKYRSSKTGILFCTDVGRSRPPLAHKNRKTDPLVKRHADWMSQTSSGLSNTMLPLKPRNMSIALEELLDSQGRANPSFS